MKLKMFQLDPLDPYKKFMPKFPAVIKKKTKKKAKKMTVQKITEPAELEETLTSTDEEEIVAAVREDDNWVHERYIDYRGLEIDTLCVAGWTCQVRGCFACEADGFPLPAQSGEFWLCEKHVEKVK